MDGNFPHAHPPFDYPGRADALENDEWGIPMGLLGEAVEGEPNPGNWQHDSILYDSTLADPSMVDQSLADYPVPMQFQYESNMPESVSPYYNSQSNAGAGAVPEVIDEATKLQNADDARNEVIQAYEAGFVRPDTEKGQSMSSSLMELICRRANGAFKLGSNPLFRNDNPPELAKANLNLGVTSIQIERKFSITKEQAKQVLQNTHTPLSRRTIFHIAFLAAFLAEGYRLRLESISQDLKDFHHQNARVNDLDYFPIIKVEDAASRCLSALMHGVNQARTHYLYLNRKHLDHMRFFNFDHIVMFYVQEQIDQAVEVALKSDIGGEAPKELVADLYHRAYAYNAQVDMMIRDGHKRDVIQTLTNLSLEEPGADHEDNWRLARGFPACERDVVHTDPRAEQRFDYFGDLDPRIPFAMKENARLDRVRVRFEAMFPISIPFDIPRADNDVARKQGLDPWQALPLGVPGACRVRREEGPYGI